MLGPSIFFFFFSRIFNNFRKTPPGLTHPLGSCLNPAPKTKNLVFTRNIKHNHRFRVDYMYLYFKSLHHIRKGHAYTLIFLGKPSNQRGSSCSCKSPIVKGLEG